MVTHSNTISSWSWIWKLKLPEKHKFLFWLACHNSVPTLTLLNHRNISPSPLCSRCGLEDETFLHCVRDCNFSNIIWHHVGFHNVNFFANLDVTDWLKEWSMGSHSFLFAATIWWAWHHRNLMCLSNENWPLCRLSDNIHIMVDSFMFCFATCPRTVSDDIFIKWINGNHSGVILKVDGSSLSTPLRAGFGSVIRNDAGFYLSGFSGYISDSSNILYAELYAIYHGLILARNLNIEDLVCYNDSLHCINLLKGPILNFHVYAVLIQDVKDLMEQNNVSVYHTLREGNQCADFMAKFGASSDTGLSYHSSPPDDLLNLLRMDAAGTFFSRD